MRVVAPQICGLGYGPRGPWRWPRSCGEEHARFRIGRVPEAEMMSCREDTGVTVLAGGGGGGGRDYSLPAAEPQGPPPSNTHTQVTATSCSLRVISDGSRFGNRKVCQRCPLASGDAPHLGDRNPLCRASGAAGRTALGSPPHAGTAEGKPGRRSRTPGEPRPFVASPTCAPRLRQRRSNKASESGRHRENVPARCFSTRTKRSLHEYSWGWGWGEQGDALLLRATGSF